MSQWEDIIIIRHDNQQSEPPESDDLELSRQAFALSDMPPQRWVEICIAALVGSPGRLGREAEVIGQHLVIWGGPKIFDERDANHLKKLVAYTNEKYREILEPVDLSGFDAFG